jgi:hypothetical protein
MKRQPSVQDISWFIDLDNRGQLDLNPPYQRRSVWTPSDRKFFLDTLFRNYPCPPIFIHKTINDEGVVTYHIVDGKQRIETILLFAKNKIALDKNFGDERLDGLKFKKLDPDMKKEFWNYNVPVDFMNIDNLDINEVFDRVNRNSRNLERQELRHARFDGWFIKECEGEADDDNFWELIKVTSKAKAKRMKNVQFVSEVLLVIIDEKIKGFDQDYLDDKYAELDQINNEEGDVFVDEDSYKEKKIRFKDIVIKMEKHNNCFTKTARTNYNLYTILSLIILEDISGVNEEELAEKYVSFMSTVESFKKADDPEELFNTKKENDNYWHNTYKYYMATRGANTDLNQRKDRYDALKEALI